MPHPSRPSESARAPYTTQLQSHNGNRSNYPRTIMAPVRRLSNNADICSFINDLSDVSELSSVPPSPSPSPTSAKAKVRPACQDDAPPASKKRRIEPEERKVQHLDLSDDATLSYSEQQAQIDLLQKTIRRHRKIVVIAGAGISTSAGSKCFPRLPSDSMALSYPRMLCHRLIPRHSSRFPVYGWPIQEPTEKT